MGGSVSGNFGNTKGSALDALSNLLTVASLIPGLDTFADLAAIPVDLARGDYLSAALDAVGVFPFVGEIGDVAKLAKMADEAVDSAKIANKAVDSAKIANKAVDAVKVANKASDAGHAVVKIPKLPKTPIKLKSSGWKETTSAAMKKNTTSRTFEKDGLTIRFDKGKKGVGGYGGKDHYHILNPNSTGKHDYYLDKYGNPVPKNSKASHLLP